MSWKKCISLMFIVASSRSFELKDMICTDEFCAQYITEKGCPALSDACVAQNSTHNGIYLPFADTCNCCDYCLTNLKEDEPCVRGIAGMLPPASICGPGLACTPNKKGATCQPISSTACATAQKDWDKRRAEGTLGMNEVRPICDDDGVFAPAHCIPGSICYCLSPEGERIFGEKPFLNPWNEHEMTCGCSINYWKGLSVVEPEFVSSMLAARCNDYGLFESLQCTTGSKGNCLCVNTISGEPLKDTLVVPLSELTRGKPACFDPSIHSIGAFETECEIMKMKWNEQTNEANDTEDTFIDPQCQPDGKYHRLQTLGTKQMCVDPSGEKIENYEANVDSPEAKTMNCHCARTKLLLEKAGVAELPSCCFEGSFEAWQCRRNECFCVDLNGDQIGLEVHIKDVATLSCYNNNQPCPLKSSFVA